MVSQDVARSFRRMSVTPRSRVDAAAAATPALAVPGRPARGRAREMVHNHLDVVNVLVGSKSTRDHDLGYGL